MANILLSYVEVFKKARPYSLYVLFVMLTTYMLNQLDRYTLSITNIKAAQDIHFGDMACMKLDNVSKEEGAACKNITSKAEYIILTLYRVFFQGLLFQQNFVV